MSERKWPVAIRKLLKAWDDEAAMVALGGLIFDHAMAQPVSRFVTADAVLGHIDRALDERITEAWVRDHIRPFFDRELARAKARGDRVGDWISAEAQAELRSLAARPFNIDRRFMEGAVKQPAVQHMLQQVIEATLDRFISTFKPGGSGGGLAGKAARRGFGLAGRALGGIGAQIENQLRGATSGFIQGSMTFMLDRLVTIVSSPETARQMGRMNLAGYDEGIKLPTAKLSALILGLPLDDLLEVAPGLLLHNLRRPEVRDGIKAEVEAMLAVEGDKPLKALIADDAAYAALRAEVVGVCAPILSEFLATEPYLEWLAGVL